MMTMEPVSVPVIRDLKERLASLALRFLGQHLWELRLQQRQRGKSQSIGCLCRCCEQARREYQIATGSWPTTEQEHEAMKDWNK